MKKIAIVVSQFNKEISDRLLAGAVSALKDNGINHRECKLVEVPGAFEIPVTVAKLIDSGKYDGIIALGCVIKGETDHYDAICDGVTYGIQKVSIESRIPVMFGILMCEEKKYALARSLKMPRVNKGYQCTKSLLEMMRLFKGL